jgi:hypothetical protein
VPTGLRRNPTTPFRNPHGSANSATRWIRHYIRQHADEQVTSQPKLFGLPAGEAAPFGWGGSPQTGTKPTRINGLLGSQRPEGYPPVNSLNRYRISSMRSLPATLHEKKHEPSTKEQCGSDPAEARPEQETTENGQDLTEVYQFP